MGYVEVAVVHRLHRRLRVMEDVAELLMDCGVEHEVA